VLLYTTLFTVQRTAATKQFKKKRKTTIDSTIRRTHVSSVSLFLYHFVNPLMATLKQQSNGPLYGDWYTGH